MSHIRDWCYFFTPEDSSTHAPHNPVPVTFRLGKILLWTCIAVLFGLFMGHSA
jgi:hypothetical protein